MKEESIYSIFENPANLAISYGGYRDNSRSIQPSIEELKEDLLILSAMGIRVVRTYNVHLPHASNVVKAIASLKKEDPSFEMYVMLGAWIDCKNAWTSLEPIHHQESKRNHIEINRAVELANNYPEIVKVISVGNEAMVKWATAYYVTPDIILKWVEHLQSLKKQAKLPKSLLVTSSDNFASWGGGEDSYKVPELERLIHSVDYISMHTYPMHDTHYNSVFWGSLKEEETLTDKERIDLAMQRSLDYAKSQYDAVKKYMLSLNVSKPIYIGETGWASVDNHLFADHGSRACDEYKAGKYYELMRAWTAKEKIPCFYFEAFDEPWKDAENPEGSENHFGLFTVDGQAKFALWSLVDQGVFEGLERNGNPITKTYEGNLDTLLSTVKLPPLKFSLISEYHAQ